jgi:hypothetical protein
MEIELERIPGEPTLEQQQAHKDFWAWYFAQIIDNENLNRSDDAYKISWFTFSSAEVCE